MQHSCKARFKSGIRDAYLIYESRFDDDLVHNVMHKKPTEFWKAWSAKFRKNISSDVKFKTVQMMLKLQIGLLRSFHQFTTTLKLMAVQLMSLCLLYKSSKTCNENGSNGICDLS